MKQSIMRDPSSHPYSRSARAEGTHKSLQNEVYTKLDYFEILLLVYDANRDLPFIGGRSSLFRARDLPSGWQNECHGSLTSNI